VSPTFHGDRSRTGWDAAEPDLTPSRVASSFDWMWDSDPLDDDGDGTPPRIHATPLYFDGLGPQPFVVVATSNSWVYAIAACTGAQRAGTILWKTQLSTPVLVPNLDGGLPLGVLSTPVADLAATPPRLYVTTLSTGGIELFALELETGAIVPGWPLIFDPATIMALDRNGPAIFEDGLHADQRAALALDASGSHLYAAFASFADTAPGWLVAIDPQSVAIVASFSAAPSVQLVSNGGMWGAGGPAIDASGNVWITAGNSEQGPLPGTWGESLLSFTPDLTLRGTYTPFDHCQLDAADTDVGGSSPLLLPDLDSATTATSHLVSFGGKQGTVYLVDRDHLPGSLSARPPCSTDSSTDGSLLPPDPQPQFGRRGPLNVFGPYTEDYGDLDHAKMRTPLVWFDGGAAGQFLYATGSTKASVSSTQSVSPSVARLKLETAPGQPAYLAIDAVDSSLVFKNAGPPLVTSNGAADPIIWVVDQNSLRTAATLDPTIASPVLYAVDGMTMAPLYVSPPDRVGIGGKYASVTIAHGWVFVVTDRLQAFGVRP